MASDPYYYSRDINAIQTQRQAVGQARSFTPEDISSIIAGNFRAQQEFGERERAFKLQEKNQKLAENAQIFNATQSIEGQKLAKSQAKAQAITGATSLAINAPLAYAAGKSAGLWGATALAPSAGQGAVTGAAEAGATGASGMALGTAGAAALGAAGLAGSIYYTGKAAEDLGLSEGLGQVAGAVAPMLLGPVAAATQIWDSVFGGSIICTELNRQKLLPDSMLRASTFYVMKYGDKEAYIGYLIFASPIVERMKTSKLITSIMRPYGEIMCRECASRTNPNKYKSTFASRLTYKISEKIFKLIYRNSVAKEVVYG